MARFFIGNLSYTLVEADLVRALQDQGVTSLDVKIIRDRETGGSRGFGFVEVVDSQVPLLLARKSVV